MLPSPRRRLLRDVFLVMVLAATLTAVWAWPVLRAPDRRVIGAASAGPHPDPFVTAGQYTRGDVPAPYWQSATDLPGIAIAQVSSGLTAFNLLVLISFPLTAAFTFLLGVTLTQSRLAAAMAALLFTWAPFHLAHAAYHVHIAQIQWWPLLWLAVCLAARHAVGRASAIVTVPAMLLVTASFYWALAAVFVVPALFAALWMYPATLSPPVNRRTAGLLCLMSIGAAMVGVAGGAWILDGEGVAFGASDLAWYSARWFSLWLPPVAHPFLGDVSASIWTAATAGPGLLEQQLSLGLGAIALAGVAVVQRWRTPDDRVVASVPMLVSVGGAAWVASMYGGDVLGEVLPMFRAYARISVVAVLSLAMMAGTGAAVLWRGAVSRRFAAALVVLVVVELFPWGDRFREALPTAGHAWIATHAPTAAALDCTAPGRVYGTTVRMQLPGMRFREPPFEDCASPDLGGTLAAHGVTYVVMRRSLRESRWLEAGGRIEGLREVAREADALVLRVEAAPPEVFTTEVLGLYPREFDRTDTWRWMPAGAEWRVMNRASPDTRAVLALEVDVFAGPRTLRVTGPGGEVHERVIRAAGMVELGPFNLPPGESRVTFEVPEGDTPVSIQTPSSDDRRLAIRIARWQWRLR
jgi:hypothetical protein